MHMIFINYFFYSKYGNHYHKYHITVHWYKYRCLLLMQQSLYLCKTTKWEQRVLNQNKADDDIWSHFNFSLERHTLYGILLDYVLLLVYTNEFLGGQEIKGHHRKFMYYLKKKFFMIYLFPCIKLKAALVVFLSCFSPL